ncbi:MAG: STAS domain-containing protein [Melioribacteraceae bacterium]|nr:STAS domain-containing protein [Melioribacteraceae bacterium]
MDNTFTVNSEGDISIVTLNISEATLKYAQSFKYFMVQRIIKNRSKIIIDCRNVNFMDSTFLGSLVYSLKKAAIDSGDLKLILGNFESPVWTMFETTNMFRIFKIYKDIESAVESYSA